MNYLVEVSTSIQALEKRVSQLIDEGYIPLGGVRVVKDPDSSSLLYIQSVYKNPY